jgi:hypothetical protein
VQTLSIEEQNASTESEILDISSPGMNVIAQRRLREVFTPQTAALDRADFVVRSR